jgi:GT2 family glycosyltransferase
MKVTIVTVHYRQKKLTRQCLDSITKLKQGHFQTNVIVVNNNPQENLRSLHPKYPDFTFLKTSKNIGFTGSYNLGIKRALKESADAVFLVNNDTILDKELLVQLIKAARLKKVNGILGPKIYFAPGSEYHRKRYTLNQRGKVLWFAGGIIDWDNVLASHRGVDEVDRGQYDRQGETDFISGCAMMIKGEVFKKIGLLDERYYLYLEDNDFCQRAIKAGFRVIYVPKAKLWHVNAGSSQVGGPLHDYFMSRNRMLFGLRFAPRRAKISLVKESLKLLFSGRPWQKKGIRDFYLGNFGQGGWDEKKVR